MNNFINTMKDLNPRHLYQVSMDGQSVNINFFQKRAKERKG